MKGDVKVIVSGSSGHIVIDESKLLDNHFEGIIAHATIKISSARLKVSIKRLRPYAGMGTAILTTNTSF